MSLCALSQDLCDNWYHECKNEGYFFDINGALHLCNEKTLVCSPLHHFIENGTEFCRVQKWEINDVAIQCFNGSFGADDMTIRDDSRAVMKQESVSNVPFMTTLHL